MTVVACLLGLFIGFGLGVYCTVLLARMAVKQGKLWVVHKREGR